MTADRPNDPSVSIVIVNRDRPDLVRQCLSCVRAHTVGYSYEIIIVDNASAPEQLEEIAALEDDFRLVNLQKDRVFGEANNIGVEKALGTYVVLLNNDCFVQHDWLTPLIEAVERLPLAGAIGPVFRGADGALQEAGAFIRPDGWSFQIGKVPPFDPDEITRTRVVDYSSAACLLMRRKTFLDVGGFDPIFEPAYFEDADLCFRIRASGLFVYCCPDSSVIHLENTTTREIWEQDKINAILTRNHARFLRRWTSVIASEFRRGVAVDSLPSPRIEPDGGGQLGTVGILLREGLTLAPPTRTALALASALQGRRQLTLVTDEMYSRTRVSHLCREFGLPALTVAVKSVAEAQLEEFGTVIEVAASSSPQGLLRGTATILFLAETPNGIGAASGSVAEDGLLSFDAIWCASDSTRNRLIVDVALHVSEATALEVSRRTATIPAPLAAEQATPSKHAGPQALALLYPVEDEELLVGRMRRLRKLLTVYFPAELTIVPYTAAGEESGEGAALSVGKATGEARIETLAWPPPGAVRAAVERASLAWFVAPRSPESASQALPSIVRQVRAAAVAGCIPIIDEVWAALDPASCEELRSAPTFRSWNEAMSIAAALLGRAEAREAVAQSLREDVAHYSDEAFAEQVRARFDAVALVRGVDSAEAHEPRSAAE